MVKEPEIDDLSTLIVAQMALDEVPTATIKFFRLVYPSLRTLQTMSCSQMSELAFMTPQAAKKHVFNLTERNYFIREHYRAWSLPKKPPLTNPLLQVIWKSI